ncbi:MAG: hypothetical protein HYR91_12660 [Flavobacteriia bacterium]|nr:hypothetical protein [Flavobacteriia bacterium]
MTKVLFDTRAWGLDAQPEMHNYFVNNPHLDIVPISVYHNTIDYKKYKHNSNCENLANYYEIGKLKYNKTEISLLESKYEFVNLWYAVYFDRFLRNQKEEEIIQQISYYIYSWEQIFIKYQPDFIVTETVTGIWNYVLFAMSKYYNCQYLGYLFTKNTNKYFFTKDLYGNFPEMEEKFNQLVNSSISNQSIHETETFIEKFKEKHMVPIYMKTTSSLPKIHNFFNIYRITINVYKDFKTKINVRNDYKIDYRINGYIRDFKRLIRIIYTKVFNIFELPIENEKFVLFPLQFQPEATTDIWSAYFNDQYNVILHLVKSLPFDHKLYVKEHYAVLGSKEIEFYKKIKRLPNVRLINPWVGINELIQKTSAVAVLTGTTGLEAIIWKKPVIIFGRVFFDIYPQLYKVEQLDKLPQIINQAINNHKVNHEMYLKYIFAYIDSGYEGRFHGGNLSHDEIIQHCDNLVTEIKLLK